MTAILDNYRPTVGLSDNEIPCRGCGGNGVDFSVPPRAVQIANLDRRERRWGPNLERRTHCWQIGQEKGSYSRPLARVELQWRAHGHDLFADHPRLRLCGTCYGQGVLVPRRRT